MSKQKSCWVTHGSTESGDSLTVLIFKNYPTDEQVDSVYKVIYPYEYEEVGEVNWTRSESLFIDN